MKNKEKYLNEITDIVIDGGALALLKDNKIANCSDVEKCEDCQFFEVPFSDRCITARKEWLEAEYCEFKKGELVEVSDDEKCWNLRFFSCMSNNYYHCTREKNSNEWINHYDWKYCRKYGTLGGLI